MVGPSQLIDMPFGGAHYNISFCVGATVGGSVKLILARGGQFGASFFDFCFFHGTGKCLLLGFHGVRLHSNVILLLSPRRRRR